MTSFDPAAATATYLAQMSPAAMAKAIAYTHGREWMLLWGFLAGLVEAWIIVRMGVLTGLRNWIEKGRPRPVLTSLVVGFAYVIVSWIVGIPWAIYSDWWFEKGFGMTSQPLAGWFMDQLKVAPFSFIVGTISLVVLYFFLRVAKRTWWLWAGLFAGVLFVVLQLVIPFAVEPMLNKYEPAPPGPVRDAVVALGHKTGTPTDKIFIYDGSKQSNRYTANVSGVFGSARVAMSDVMFKKGADIAEVRGVVGHEMGHYVHQHVLIGTAAITLIALVTFWLVDKLFPMFAGLLGAGRVKGIADPAGLPVFFAAIAAVGLLMTPVVNTLTRAQEADADNFSLQYANEPDGLSEALIKTADYRAPSPPRWEEIIFYDHPAVGRRIRNAMDWKARHMADQPAPATASAPPKP
jgi:STE24 endopeptidase